MFDRSGYSFTIPERDQNGFKALGELEDRAVNLVANALTQAVDHVHSFFVLLRCEIGFYVACLNLRESSTRRAGRADRVARPGRTGRAGRPVGARALYDAVPGPDQRVSASSATTSTPTASCW